ncbi:hypothetical protein TYRP_022080 [Tyrophagus putrescentiae]|nr:hypothetical protein TYRP_022080 [Tyrophagus putrescentiae]
MALVKLGAQASSLGSSGHKVLDNDCLEGAPQKKVNTAEDDGFRVDKSGTKVQNVGTLGSLARFYYYKAAEEQVVPRSCQGSPETPEPFLLN